MTVLVVIPTYNERESLPPIVRRVHAAVPDAHVLVVDDNSPDGTGEIADKLAVDDDRVLVLHRTAKNGLGAAYVAGFGWALSRDYTTIVQLDADGSHPPETLPQMLAASDRGADLVLGSRYVPGGHVVNWPKHREYLSRGANLYSRIALGVGVHDVTAGFRVYRREVLEKLALDGVASQGYCFQIDLTLRTVKAGFDVVEVPITFTEREHGQSKMSSSIVFEALLRVAQWGVRRRFEQVRRLARRR